jgi:hypothetical protein
MTVRFNVSLSDVAANVDSFGAKRMRKHTQRRAVDYTSTVVRYIQVMYSHCCSQYFFVRTFCTA